MEGCFTWACGEYVILLVNDVFHKHEVNPIKWQCVQFSYSLTEALPLGLFSTQNTSMFNLNNAFFYFSWEWFLLLCFMHFDTISLETYSFRALCLLQSYMTISFPVYF